MTSVAGSGLELGQGEGRLRRRDIRLTFVLSLSPLQFFCVSLLSVFAYPLSL